MKHLPYRQIHLDFHTSGLIEGVGELFDAKAFAECLSENHVNSINLFTKGHHGFYYYPTKLGNVHPHLKPGLDLFGEQVKACREKGIRTVAYTAVAWAEDTCDQHPEWMQVNEKGVVGAKEPFSDGYYQWRALCINNRAYIDYLKKEMLEVYTNYKPSGFWIDIIWSYHCVCACCQQDMRKNHLCPDCHSDVATHDRMVELAFMKEIYEYLHGVDDTLEVYFNGGPAEFDLADDAKLTTLQRALNNDFIDIESLPSDIWGYTHFPVLVNHANRFDKPLTMMNGKFHTSWGDFGSLRNKAALEYECFRALANGAGVCVGDQLHPCGKLDFTVYRHIGSVFEQIKAKERYCIGSTKVANVAVFAGNYVLESERAGENVSNQTNSVNEGVYRILSELKIPFDFITYQDEKLDDYELIILPDRVTLDEMQAKKLSAYVKQGGKVLATGFSCLNPEKTAYAIRENGLQYVGKEPCHMPYAHIEKEHFPSIETMDYVLYEQGEEVEMVEGKALSYLVLNYFNRTWDAFCSHRQTPPQITVSEKPFIVQNNGFITITHPLFNDYALHGCKVYKDLIRHCIKTLIDLPLYSNLPSTAEYTMRKLGNDLIIHLLEYVPTKRCKSIDIIEDVIPLYNVYMDVKLQNPPSSIKALLPDEALPFTYENGRATFTIPSIEGHKMILLKDVF